MKIVNTKTVYILDEINNGECFMLNNHIYIKLCDGYERNAFDLNDNKVKQIPVDQIVTPVKTELHIL